MTYPTPGLAVTVPYWYSGFGGTPTVGQTAAGTVTLDTLTTFEWGQDEASWTLRVNVGALTEPPGGATPYGPAFEWKAYRYRVSDSTWVGASSVGVDKSATWTLTAASGGTGGFYAQFPTSQNGTTGVFTYTAGVNIYYLWPSNILDGSLPSALPLATMTVRPAIRVTGGLRTAIDGGAP